MKTHQTICFVGCIWALVLEGCTKAEWYQEWLDGPQVKGCQYNAEFSLKDGESRKVQISSDNALIVGCVVSNNEVFTNNSAGLLFGSDEDLKPSHRRGLPIHVIPNNGVITTFVKNASGVDTKVMVWSAVPGDCPFMDANARGGNESEEAGQ